MTGPAPPRQSRSFRLYARLVELYPSSFLHRHRAEMLQDFADLEDAAASEAKLWLLIGKDLTMSLVSHFSASRLGRTVNGVFIAWMLLFAIGYFSRPSTPGYPALHVFGGFLLGMLSMYIATRLYGAPQNSSYVIGVLVASILLFTIGYFALRQHARPSDFASLRRPSAWHAVDIHQNIAYIVSIDVSP